MHARIKTQLDHHDQYPRFTRHGESDPDYVATYIRDIGPEDALLYTVLVDVFSDRIVAKSEMIAPDGQAHYFEMDEATSVEGLELQFLGIWRSLQLGSTLYLT